MHFFDQIKAGGLNAIYSGQCRPECNVAQSLTPATMSYHIVGCRTSWLQLDLFTDTHTHTLTHAHKEKTKCVQIEMPLRTFW